MTGRRAFLKAVLGLPWAGRGKRQVSGFSNPLVGGGGALVYPSIHSPNFNIANPPASPAQSWALLKSGVAYLFGVLVQGGNVVITGTGGMFVYSGVPGPGNPPVDWVSQAAADPYGNALPAPGNGTRSGNAISALSAGDLILGNTAFTGQAILSAGAGGGGTASLSIESPDTSGTDTRATVNLVSRAAGTGSIMTIGADLHVFSQLFPSGTAAVLAKVATQEADLTGAMASAGDVAPVLRMLSQLLAGNAPQFLFNGSLTSTAGTPAQPTVITTDSFTVATLANPGDWTAGVGVPLAYALGPDNTVQLAGELQSTGIIAAGRQLTTLPAGYRPASAVRLTANYNTGTATVAAVLITVSTSGVVTTFPAIPNASTLNVECRFRLGY